MLEITITLRALENVRQKDYNPLYKKGMKQNLNRPKETTRKEKRKGRQKQACKKEKSTEDRNKRK